MKRHILLALVIGTSAIAGVLALLKENPLQSPAATAYMPVTVGALVLGVWVMIRSIVADNSASVGYIRSTWRQGILWGLVAGVLLYLQGLRALSAVEILLVILAAALLELFFRADKAG